jgi:hypothetical protein
MMAFTVMGQVQKWDAGSISNTKVNGANVLSNHLCVLVKDVQAGLQDGVRKALPVDMAIGSVALAISTQRAVPLPLAPRSDRCR